MAEQRDNRAPHCPALVTMIKCTACGFELPPQDYLNHRRHECPGPGNENIAGALDRVALELEIQNLFNHGTLDQLVEAESRRAALRKG